MSEKGSRHRPWFPFFAGDFINATRRWSCEEIGAYILLLGEQWINEDVPTDVDELARIHPDIAKHWERKLKSKFPAGRNPRMEELREEMMQRSAKNRESALRRWGRDPENYDNDMDDANAHALAHANADANGDASGYAKGYAKTVRKPMLSTPTSTSIQKPKSKSKKQSSLVNDTMWKKFCDLYPKRDGPDPNKGARAKAETALRKGALWADIMTGLRRYRKHCDESGIDPKFIQRKETFLNPAKEFWQAEYADPDPVRDVGVAAGKNPDDELRQLGVLMGIRRQDNETEADHLQRIRIANAARLKALGS
jgi:uncharacterized protein YdaU (DUF1376 family)